MKTRIWFYLLVSCSVFFVFSCDNSSSRDPQGYQNIKWSSSIDEVKRQYPDIRIMTNDSGLLSQEYREDVDDKYIDSRSFIFFQNKLVGVDITMIRTANSDEILYSLIEKYGKKYEKKLDGPDDDMEVISWNFPTTKIDYVRVIQNKDKTLEGKYHAVRYFDQQIVKLENEMKAKAQKSSVEDKESELKKLPL